MVTTGTMVCMASALLIAFGIPVFLWGSIGHKVKRFPLCVLYGTAIYLLLQVLVLSPLQIKLQNSAWYTDLPWLKLVLSSSLCGIGFTICQLAVFFLGMRGEKDLRLAAGMGIGQGIAEELLVVGITYFNNLAFAIMVNTGQLQDTLGQAGLSAETIEAMRRQLIETPGYLYLLSSFERIVFLAVHLLSAVLMAMFFLKGKYLIGIFLSAGCHIAVSMTVGALGFWAEQTISYLVLSLLTVLVLICLWILIRVTKQNITLKSC